MPLLPQKCYKVMSMPQLLFLLLFSLWDLHLSLSMNLGGVSQIIPQFQIVFLNKHLKNNCNTILILTLLIKISNKEVGRLWQESIKNQLFEFMIKPLKHLLKSNISFCGKLVQNCHETIFKKNIMSKILANVAKFDHTPKESLQDLDN